MRNGLHLHLSRRKEPDKFWFYHLIEHTCEIWHGYIFDNTIRKAKMRLIADDTVWRYDDLEYCGIVSEEVVKKVIKKHFITQSTADIVFKRGFVVHCEVKENVS